MIVGRYQQPCYRLALGGKIVNVNESDLLSLEKSDSEKYKKIDEIIYQYQKCPIGNFLPHGVIQDGQKDNDGLRMLNDWDSNLILLIAGNQLGKTFQGAAFCILHGLIPTEKSWNCYKKHGIIYREWTGPKTLIVASYSWDNTKTMWDTYLNLLPRSELKEYSPYWGKFHGEKGKRKSISFGANATKEIELNCGSKIICLCHGTERLEHFEGKTADIIHLDEQCPEDKFNALTQRQLTRGGGYTPILMTLTPHILPDRPDTGASSWIKQKLIDKNQTMGRKFSIYKLSVESTPNGIISPEQKKRTRIQWVEEPEANHDIKKINEGRARYYGEWHVGGGLVFSDFNPDIHIVEEFPVESYKPQWERYIDHGQNPCAAILIARLPWGDAVVVKEYYVHGRSISENARGIIEEMCGNSAYIVDSYREGDREISVYNERFMSKIIAVSELDCRSYGTKESDGHRSYGQIFNEAGLACNPATGQPDKFIIPLAKEQFALDKNRKHINSRIGKPVTEVQGKYGAPQLYVISTCVNLINELKQYAEVISKNKGIYATKTKGADHLISCLKFHAGRSRRYNGEYLEFDNSDEEE